MWKLPSITPDIERGMCVQGHCIGGIAPAGDLAFVLAAFKMYLLGHGSGAESGVGFVCPGVRIVAHGQSRRAIAWVASGAMGDLTFVVAAFKMYLLGHGSGAVSGVGFVCTGMRIVAPGQGRRAIAWVASDAMGDLAFVVAAFKMYVLGHGSGAVSGVGFVCPGVRIVVPC